LHQNLPWTSGDVRAKFHQDWCRGLDSHQPSTYQQTNKHLYVHFYIYRLLFLLENDGWFCCYIIVLGRMRGRVLSINLSIIIENRTFFYLKLPVEVKTMKFTLKVITTFKLAALNLSRGFQM